MPAPWPSASRSRRSTDPPPGRSGTGFANPRSRHSSSRRHVVPVTPEPLNRPGLTYLAGVSVRRVEDITEALRGRVSPSTVRFPRARARVRYPGNASEAQGGTGGWARSFGRGSCRGWSSPALRSRLPPGRPRPGRSTTFRPLPWRLRPRDLRRPLRRRHADRRDPRRPAADGLDLRGRPLRRDRALARTRAVRLLLASRPEAGLGQQFGAQDETEVWAALYLRYRGFPWDHVLVTSFAISTGLNSITHERTRSRAKAAQRNYLAPQGASAHGWRFAAGDRQAAAKPDAASWLRSGEADAHKSMLRAQRCSRFGCCSNPARPGGQSRASWPL